MKQLLTPIICLLFIACEKNEIVSQPKEYTLTIDSVLTQNGLRSLTKDQNGLYHLRMVTMGSSQSHRVVGRILVNGKEPYPNEKITFESNLYWWIRRGDVTAIITRAYINYFTGQFTIINLPPMVAGKDELVPTTNSSTYSGKGGEINTVIAPIREMIGDTMVLKTLHSLSNKIIYTKIVIE